MTSNNHHKYFARGKKEVVTIPGQVMMEFMRAVHEKGASFRFQAMGSSMTPSIRNNDFLTISPLNGIGPFPGEVVACQHPENLRLVLHRVVKTKKNSFVIRGDRLNIIDGIVPLENIIGVVTRIERNGKSIFLPNRFHYPIRTKIYYRLYLFYIISRRFYRDIRSFFRKQ